MRVATDTDVCVGVANGTPGSTRALGFAVRQCKYHFEYFANSLDFQMISRRTATICIAMRETVRTCEALFAVNVSKHLRRCLQSYCSTDHTFGDASPRQIALLSRRQQNMPTPVK
jgi:hypothetical protein